MNHTKKSCRNAAGLFDGGDCWT
ncbi:MAG TPA: hypothetical protein DCY72_02375 [Ruminococcaceae bacterium]|nr:hypothetical protein [Oscillospiraceae bacterium]